MGDAKRPSVTVPAEAVAEVQRRQYEFSSECRAGIAWTLRTLGLPTVAALPDDCPCPDPLVHEAGCPELEATGAAARRMAQSGPSTPTAKDGSDRV